MSGVGTIIDMREVLSAPTHVGVDAIIVANAREASQVSNDLKSQNKDDQFIVIYPGMIIAGFRFRNVHLSDGARFRAPIDSYAFDHWLNYDVRPRMMPGSAFIRTP